MRAKAVIIILCILASLIPAYAMLGYLKKWLRPRESGSRFAAWLLSALAFIFLYTFLVVFIIRLVFPRA